ncbi:hypothetical protein BVG16_17475 [Paenibacillus selenitireducens]|uniref:AAA domain-containing protein n=1 Tax=Paenibacillus selenitireducens TaxID=1324314 RepID=A0A1T2XAK7_9BACL|nr:AAA family ATPase [Paenibacillus selenitireducens]OPA76934.1 hypothetical protein BVG16_17475 [Paenibacillus selenitireducens]
MKKLHLILAVEDRDYAELFVQYIQASDFMKEVIVKSFTQLESFRYYVQHESSVDLIVAEASFLVGDTLKDGVSPVMMLTEDVGGGEITREGEVPKIGKYQPLHLLVSSLLTFYASERNRPSGRSHHRTEQTRMIAVYSAVAGMGKTTVALNLCKQWALQGQRVFYLSLELLNSMESIVRLPEGRTSDKQENRFSKLLYYLKADRAMDELVREWASYKHHDAAMHIEYVEPVSNLDEMKQLTQRDTERLLDLLVRTGAYDVVVLDLDSVLEERTLVALERCDQIIWLLQDDLLALRKTEAILQYMERSLSAQIVSSMLHKTCCTMNRYQGNMLNSLRASRLRVQAHLPYITAWKQIDQGQVLLQSATFQAAILKLCAGEVLNTEEQGAFRNA